MIGLLGILIALFLVTLALGYKVCVIGSKEKGWLAILGVVIGIIIIVTSLAGGIGSAVYLHKIIPKMGAMMGMPMARPGTPGMMPQRGSMPSPGMNMPQRPTPPAPRPSEEKR